MPSFQVACDAAALTVITPTYNRAGYLRETIDSVLSQGVRGLQYIVMDDGSTDATDSVVAAYANAIEYYRHENIGEQRTVNRALRMAHGRFFMIVNSDDPLLPNCLVKMLNVLADAPDVLAAYPDWQVIGPNSDPIVTIRVPSFDTPHLLTTVNVAIGPGACFRRSVLDLVGYRNPLLRYSADLDYWHRIALAGPILHVPETLATHRVHPASTSRSERGELLARETRYLYEVYSRHPRLRTNQRQVRTAASACGHFAAAFVCISLNSAACELVRGFLSNPVALLACLDAHGVAATLDFLESLGGKPEPETGKAFRAALATKCRVAAWRTVARGVLLDPVGWLGEAARFGISDLGDLIRGLPLIRR